MPGVDDHNAAVGQALVEKLGIADADSVDRPEPDLWDR
jgi:hypothetical protein